MVKFTPFLLLAAIASVLGQATAASSHSSDAHKTAVRSHSSDVHKTAVRSHSSNAHKTASSVRSSGRVIHTGTGGPVRSGVAMATGGRGHYHNTTSHAAGGANTTNTVAANGFSPVVPCQQGGGTLHGCGNCFPGQAITPVDLSNATLQNFNNSEFVTQGGGGGTTWFSVPAVPPKCKVLFFSAAPDMQPPYGVPGLMTAIASSEGCYFVDTPNQIAVSYCCETDAGDQCEDIGAGLVSTGVQRRRTAHEFRREIESGSKPAPRRLASTPRRTKLSELEKRQNPPVYTFFSAANTYSTTDNYVPPPPGPAQWCEPATLVPGGQNYARAGKQQLVGTIQQCTGTFCSFEISTSVESSTELSISSDVQDTSSHGENWSGTVGLGGAVTVLATVGGDKSWSNAITNSTGTTNSKSYTSSISDTLGVQYGTWAQLALVPQETCTPMVAQCYNGTTMVTLHVDKCVPNQNASDPTSAAYVAFPVNFGL